MPKRLVDQSILNAIAATGPDAEALVRDLLASRRGRPAKDEAAYRRLDLWWKAFRRLNSTLTEKQALKKFFRVRCEAIKRELDLSRKTAESLRKAITRGSQETARVNQKRRQELPNWRRVPTGLAQAVHGRHWMFVRDPDKAAYLEAAQAAALGVTGPFAFTSFAESVTGGSSE